jgi:uncharacterized Fe-S cluster protein YjdI
MSSDKEIIREYTNGELTVIWKSKSCIHAAECVHRLPQVYNPNEKPWIKAQNASTNELKSQIEACPSGALTYRMNNNINKRKEMENIKVEVLKNGPLIVHGTLEIVNAKGEKEVKEKTTAFCRCGVSQNKPYCDGAHKKAEFKG